MDDVSRGIRRIFLSPHPHQSLATAARWLRITLPEIRRAVEDGSIVAIQTRIGLRIAREELMAAAMQRWSLEVIEAALGAEGGRFLPDAIRLVELRTRVPRYQRDLLDALAKRKDTTVDEILRRELDDVASAHAEELRDEVPGFAEAMSWS